MKLFFFLYIFSFLLSCQRYDSDSENRLSENEIYFHANKFVRWFYSYELDSLSPYFQNKKFTLHDLNEFRVKVDNQLGMEVELLSDRVYFLGYDNKIIYGYVRHSRFSKTEHPVRTLFEFDYNKKIYGFEIVALPDEAPNKFSNYQTKTELRLPFEGEWFVAAGGRSIIDNHHAISVDQRFAYDFLIKKNKYTFANNGASNEDYYCFGEKVLAPGDGIIVKVVNDVNENKVGYMPEGAGNLIIIDHENGEFSVLAHFKKGSIVVKVGEAVVSGQFLGLCGNSGHSSQPHIHYHLQTTPIIFSGEGLPAQFLSYISNSNYIEKGEPSFGEIIRNK